jgi:hypothetical protein
MPLCSGSTGKDSGVFVFELGREASVIRRLIRYGMAPFYQKISVKL